MKTVSLESALIKALEATSASLAGDGGAAGRPVSVILEPPRSQAHGDFATNVAMQLAKTVRRAPLEVAQQLAQSIPARLEKEGVADLIEKIEIKPPGFINFFLSPKALYQTLADVLASRDNYGRTDLGQAEKIQVEFVSANPTGPLSVAHGRQAAVGDSLANILAFSGHDVTREYYLNDEGNQIEVLGNTLLARYLEILGLPFEFPENGYKGGYMKTLAQEVVASEGKKWAENIPGRKEWFMEKAAGSILEIIRAELTDFQVRFDVWYSQKSLSVTGKQDDALEFLKQQKYLYLQEGAWWLKSTAFGDDKDRVVIRSDGRPTYIAADIAYHREKFRRGFKRVVNLWGPDHHGYIPRMQAAIQAMGYSKEALSVVIVQLCTLKRGNEIIPMSTREGEFVTVREVMQEVGVDAARFFFVMRKTDSHLDFDLELAKKAAPENPVYYIQYAHARICSIRAKSGESSGSWNPQLLSHSEELQLMRRMREFPSVIEACAKQLEPHGVARYLMELATDFHKFYDVHRVVTDDAELTRARLHLIEAVSIVLAVGLKLLGVSAPTKM